MTMPALLMRTRTGPHSSSTRSAVAEIAGVSVLGPADLTFDEAAQAIGEGIGRPVSHVTVTAEQAREAMTGGGLSLGLAEAFIAIFAANDRYALVSDPPRDERSTTSTSLQEFARTVVRPLLKQAEIDGVAA